MIKVLFFARMREQLGHSELQLEYGEHLGSVSMLRSQLIADNGPSWAEVLMADNVICAVNQEIVEPDLALHDGDEVAFFPPVTGG